MENYLQVIEQYGMFYSIKGRYLIVVNSSLLSRPVFLKIQIKNV